MKGELLTLKPDGTRDKQPLTGEPGLDLLHDIVGGYIEVVPYFSTIEIDGVVHNCIAFCNEEGKFARPEPLPLNARATDAWDSSMRRAGIPTGAMPDHLVGNIAVIIGDEVLQAMRTDSD